MEIFLDLRQQGVLICYQNLGLHIDILMAYIPTHEIYRSWVYKLLYLILNWVDIEGGKREVGNRIKKGDTVGKYVKFC